MPKASNLKYGNIVKINDQIYMVKQVEVKTPSSRGSATLYKVRFADVKTGHKLDGSYKGAEFIEDVDLERRKVQFLYKDKDNLYTFMDLEDYNQYTANGNDLGEKAMMITDSLEGMIALLLDGNIVSIELPNAIDLEIQETSPAIKGASEAGRTKIAILSTGLEIQVPEHLDIGDVVKVNSETGKYMSKASS